MNHACRVNFDAEEQGYDGCVDVSLLHMVLCDELTNEAMNNTSGMSTSNAPEDVFGSAIPMQTQDTNHRDVINRVRVLENMSLSVTRLSHS